VATIASVKVAIVTESFLPQVNGVTNSVCRVLEYLAGQGHDALVVAPGAGRGAEEHAGRRVRLTPGIPLPFAGGPLDLVRPGVNGLLYLLDDVEALQASVRALMTDEALRTRLAGQARASVCGRDWASVCDQLIAHYDEVRSGAGERRAA
jgi:hypothetical protein